MRGKMIFELLAADQPTKNSHPDPDSKFWKWSEKLSIDQEKFPKNKIIQNDVSHPSMHVNLEACINCNLCVRACRDVQSNDVIGMAYRGHKSKVIFEPGRAIIGNTGILVSKVVYIKKNKEKNFVILDAAMNDFMRPALYGASHKTLPAVKIRNKSKKSYEFVGPICESTDKFISLKKFQEVKENDLIVICDVGAYGMSLSSNYNMRPKPPELLISGSKVKVIRKRQKHKDLL